MGEIAKLVRDDLCFSNLRIHITVRVTLNPIVDTRICNVIAPFNRKGTIDCASCEFINCA